MAGLVVASLSVGDWVAIVVCLVVLVLFAAPLIWLCLRFVQMDDEAVVNAIEDVQRFVDLTEQARLEMAGLPRLSLLDPDGAAVTAAAINRFVARKELARQALSRQMLSQSRPVAAPAANEEESIPASSSLPTSSRDSKRPTWRTPVL